MRQQHNGLLVPLLRSLRHRYHRENTARVMTESGTSPAFTCSLAAGAGCTDLGRPCGALRPCRRGAGHARRAGLGPAASHRPGPGSFAPRNRRVTSLPTSPGDGQARMAGSASCKLHLIESDACATPSAEGVSRFVLIPLPVAALPIPSCPLPPCPRPIAAWSCPSLALPAAGQGAHACCCVNCCGPP